MQILDYFQIYFHLRRTFLGLNALAPFSFVFILSVEKNLVKMGIKRFSQIFKKLLISYIKTVFRN